VSYARFKTHCGMHPDWAAEARRISKVNGDAGKGARLAKRTYCANGHAFAEHGRWCHTNGWKIRQCRACERTRYDRGGIINPDVIEKVKAALESGLTISAITSAGPTRLIKHNTFKRFREKIRNLTSSFLRLRQATAFARCSYSSQGDPSTLTSSPARAR
jgi:hypothetical protein